MQEVLTACDQLWCDETVEVRFLAIPEYPQFFGGSEGEGRRRGGAHLIDVCRLRRRHAPPDAQYVAGQAARVAADHRVRQRRAALLPLAAATRLPPYELTPFYAIQLRLEREKAG